jgi:hypothetical protein
VGLDLNFKLGVARLVLHVNLLMPNIRPCNTAKLDQLLVLDYHPCDNSLFAMHLMYTIDEDGKRIYTLRVRFLALILTTFRLMGDNIENDR